MEKVNTVTVSGLSFITVMFTLFWGTPDLHDALLWALTDGAFEPLLDLTS